MPEAAEPIVRTVEMGSIERRANETPEGVMTRTLEAANCEADVMRLETSEESIYGALSCDRFFDDEAGDLFLGKDLAIVLEVSNTRYRILLETLEGAQAEFTVEGIWVE